MTVFHLDVSDWVVIFVVFQDRSHHHILMNFDCDQGGDERMRCLASYGGY